jgi:SNF2-related domain
MWRTSKNSVAKELGIPEQHSAVKHLQLTPVEWHAYRRTHKDTAEHAQAVLPDEVLQAIATKGFVPDSMNRNLNCMESNSLFPRLLRLRQVCCSIPHASVSQFSKRCARSCAWPRAIMHPLIRVDSVQTCCHPQLGQQGHTGPTQKSAKTMDEVLAGLVEQDRVEAEDAQRILIAAYNGLAGLALLQERAADAVVWYNEVLRLDRENAGVCEVDSLQKIHAMANLGVPLPAQYITALQQRVVTSWTFPAVQ